MSKLEANNKSLKREINEAHINIQEREHTIKIKSLELEELLQKLEIISEEHKAMSGQRKELEKKVHTLNSDNQLLVKKILELKEEQVKRFNEANEIYEEAAKLRKDSLLTKYDENSASQGFLEFDMSDINPQYILASPVGLTVRRTPHRAAAEQTRAEGDGAQGRVPLRGLQQPRHDARHGRRRLQGEGVGRPAWSGDERLQGVQQASDGSVVQPGQRVPGSVLGRQEREAVAHEHNARRTHLHRAQGHVVRVRLCLLGALVLHGQQRPHDQVLGLREGILREHGKAAGRARRRTAPHRASA